jgi:hypothetical protein
MYKTIFLKENEKDIFQALKNQGIKTKVFEHRLAELFNRVYNNYVGYYVFKQDDIVYKMIVLPKTIEPSDNAEKEFIDYLLHYYRIKNIYKIDKEKNIPNSLLQLAFESNNRKENSHDFLDEFQSHRYRAILQDIGNFFKRHKNSKRIKIDYVSQSIKHTLNLRCNIKELDKTKIHQMQNKDVVFSVLATVTYNALKLFIAQKYSTTHGDILFKEVKKLQAMLLKKYNIERGYKLSLSTLQGIKLIKLFGKTEENKQLLVDIKSLFGFEQMYKDDAIAIDYRQDMATTSFFINPSNFYEWYVYDILKRYADDNDKRIQFDKKEGTATEYFLNKEPKSSNPDYILIDEVNKVKIVIDAKWKNVNEFGDVKPSDYLKLKFDASLIESKGYGVGSYLIYPCINIPEQTFNIFVDDKSVFNFNTIEISMTFKDSNNGLDFDFDTTELVESININTQTEKLKVTSEILSETLSNTRTEILSKLIDAEDSEKKDVLKEELDCQLLDSAISLSEQIDEQKILPEIEEILTKYDTVLEEESKKFLKSSSVIYSYYKEKDYKHFDYSMPGSGFWKLIELELNTSFIWYLRIQSNVCNKNSPWVKICSRNKRIEQNLDNGKKVLLTQAEKQDKTKLQSVMFGGIQLLLKDYTTLDEFETFFEQYRSEEAFIKNDLVKLIEQVSIFRNEHAHIKAMSLEKFEQLWVLLFQEENNATALSNIIEFKKKMKVYIDAQ